MIKIYGMPSCPYCAYVHQQIIGRENEFEYIDIGENIRNMSAFTRLRDTNPVFDRMKGYRQEHSQHERFYETSRHKSRL